MVKAYNLSVAAPIGKWNIPCADYETMREEMRKIANNLFKDGKIEEKDIEIIDNDFVENVSSVIKKEDFKRVSYSSKLKRNNGISIIIYDISMNYN